MAGTFDEQSIRRIAKAVLDSERRNRSRQPRGKKNWQPVQGEAGFDRCQGRAVGSFTSGASTITVDNVVATKGPSPLDDPESLTETMDVHNAFGWDGDDNALVYFEYHVNDTSPDPKDRWYAYQVACPAEA